MRCIKTRGCINYLTVINSILLYTFNPTKNSYTNFATHILSIKYIGLIQYSKQVQRLETRKSTKKSELLQQKKFCKEKKKVNRCGSLSVTETNLLFFILQHQQIVMAKYYACHVCYESLFSSIFKHLKQFYFLSRRVFTVFPFIK